MVSAITSQLLYMHTEQEDEWSVLSQVSYCTCTLTGGRMVSAITSQLLYMHVNWRTNGQCYHKSATVHAC